MPIDGIVVKNIVFELKNTILNGRIEKIYQPEKDEIIIGIRSDSNSFKLLMTSNASYPRIHFTCFSKDNPKIPPMFCMVLRKHLIGGRIIDIVQPQLERIIELHIQSPNQIGDLTTKKLIIEIMGKHSNIILIDENNKILDSIKHISEDISSVREVLPNLLYTAPPCQKLNPLKTTFDEFKNFFLDSDNNNLSKIFLNKFVGFGNLISNEIIFRYSLNSKSSNTFDINGLWDEFNKIVAIMKNNTFTPTLFSDPLEDKPVDFSSIDIFQYKDYDKTVGEQISNIIETYFFEKDQRDRMKQKSEEIRKQVQVLSERSIRKIERFEEKLIECKNKEKFKILGDLIFANIHNICAGQNELITQNYYVENQKLITIPLDIQLSPSQNAQKYYKAYSKLKNAEQSSLEQLKIAQIEIDYLESVLSNLENCSTVDDISQVRIELEDEGYLKKSKLKRKSGPLSKPLSFKSSDGFKILVGKNNVQNDQLTLKLSGKNDIWLHTKLIHGSHVIIKSENKQIPDQTLLEGAMIAAYHSKAKNSSNVQVDYTYVKNVKKPSGAKPGMVIYVDYKTIVVTPDANIIEKLRKD